MTVRNRQCSQGANWRLGRHEPPSKQKGGNNMKKIDIYDIEDERIEKICEEQDITTAELIEALLDAVDAGEINLKDWL